MLAACLGTSGKQTMRQWVAEDLQVAVNYVSSPDKAEEVAREIKGNGGEAMTVKANTGKVRQAVHMLQ